jgi:hypothetical protein
MTNLVLAVAVVGTVAVALVIDLAALAAWVRRQWQ